MGIDYDAVCFYGTYFTYDELKHIKFEDSLENEYLQDTWYNMGNKYISPFYDCDSEHKLYCMGEYLELDERWYRTSGVKISVDDLKVWLDKHKQNVENKIIAFCEKYNLEYREPSFIAFPSIY